MWALRPGCPSAAARLCCNLLGASRLEPVTHPATITYDTDSSHQIPPERPNPAPILPFARFQRTLFTVTTTFASPLDPNSFPGAFYEWCGPEFSHWRQG